MKLLLDQNISRKLVPELADFFPGTAHVYELGLQRASDQKIWDYAQQHNFTIITQDADFYDRSIIEGYPPKVIWLRTGNTSSINIMHILQKRRNDIEVFHTDTTLSCIRIYS